jgi:hypothetical protein
MASTVAVGIDGSFTTLSGYNGSYYAWEGEISQAVAEITNYGTNFRQYRGGVMGMSFTARGNPKFDAATHSPVPDSTDIVNLTKVPGSATLQVATGCTYSGTVIIETTRISTDQRTNDTSLEQSGRFSGQITQTWDET